MATSLAENDSSSFGSVGLAGGQAGRVGFAVELPRTFSINLQLLGGIWILQVFATIVFGLFTRWFHRWALLAGWLT